MRLPPALRLLLPGIRVKRWMALSLGSSALIVFGALCLIGQEGMRGLYTLLLDRFPFLWRPVLGGMALALGVGGATLGMAMAVRSITAAFSSRKAGSLAEALYQTRVLPAAPQVVAVGGGTGLPTVLRGLKTHTANLTAVVTVMDSGGSSGRLRLELDVLPPGDVRNCLLALAEDEERMAQLFQFRFHSGEALAGHSLGNLLLAGLDQLSGGLDRAVEEASYMLSVRGQVLPATLDKTNLTARMQDGAQVDGEEAIAEDPRRIERVGLNAPARPYQPVLDVLGQAELITLGPGSLFTSVVPSLLVEGMSEAIVTSAAERFVIMNLMTQPGETDDFTAHDHLRTLRDYVDISRFHAMVVNTQQPPDELLARYREDGSVPVKDDLQGDRAYGLRVIRAPLMSVMEVSGKPTIKHDTAALARLLTSEARCFRRSWTRWFTGASKRGTGNSFSP
ncbi:MAG: uridine diphosphate-N-acetylglucosamine-binding protein YvcK [Candidatus Bipolaricaulota bacterium]